MLDKQIYRVLSKQKISFRSVQKTIDELDFKYVDLIPRSCVVAIDTTYFGRNFGVTIFRDVTKKVIIHCAFVERENMRKQGDGIE